MLPRLPSTVPALEADLGRNAGRGQVGSRAGPDVWFYGPFRTGEETSAATSAKGLPAYWCSTKTRSRVTCRCHAPHPSAGFAPSAARHMRSRPGDSCSTRILVNAAVRGGAKLQEGGRVTGLVVGKGRVSGVRGAERSALRGDGAARGRAGRRGRAGARSGPPPECASLLSRPGGRSPRVAAERGRAGRESRAMPSSAPAPRRLRASRSLRGSSPRS